ncbi:hypothetical protein AGLY_014424 [Aphis glycines]|uniref:Transmembrane protein n=1 Tax=Aphis glycines TaxID=307491 RepID=A0A6G0T3F5_APHGL|nr:hypothetical protein AGLY_014424 [Aphis glycines]
MLQFQTLVSDDKVKSKNFLTVFKKIEKNKKKSDGKTGIFTQNQYLTKSIFIPLQFLIFLIIFFLIVDKKFWVAKKIENVIQIKLLRYMSKPRKFAMHLNFKRLGNRVTITIYLQTKLNICYNLKTINRQLKFSEDFSKKIFLSVDKIFLVESKYFNILYKVPHKLKNSTLSFP